MDYEALDRREKLFWFGVAVATLLALAGVFKVLEWLTS